MEADERKREVEKIEKRVTGLFALQGQRNAKSFCDEDERKLVEKPVEETYVMTGVEEMNEMREKEKWTDKEIETFLHKKGLSENLITTLINTELTIGNIRLLRILDLDDNDIEKLQYLQRAMLGDNKSSYLCVNSDSSDSSSDKHLSLDCLYLKNILSKPLIEGLREVIAKKPADPVEYLGHWLLHFKACEERNKRQREEEFELLIMREKFRIKEEEGKDSLPIERQEKTSEDWNYFDYGE